MRLFLITQDEPVYAPRYVGRILAALGSGHEVVGVTALDPGGALGFWGVVRMRLRMYGPVDFARAGVRFVAARLLGLLSGRVGARHSVRRLADERGIPLLQTGDVNDPGYVGRVAGLAPDLLLSVAATQRFGRALLAVPQVAAVNLHSSLLPAYRGLDGLFWALAGGEDTVGVTLHEMSAALDAGGIVGQQPIPVGDASLHDLYLKAMVAGAALVAEAADRYEAGPVETAPNDLAAGSYHSWPTREASRRFRALGRKFF